MSTPAEKVTASLSEKSPTLEPVDAIAELLVSEDESDQEGETGEATPTKTPILDEDEESNEQETADDDDEDEDEDQETDTDLEAIAEDDPTWAGVLGVNEDQLSFNEEGDIVGFNTKVNGESETIDLSTLIAGYQNNKAFTGKSQAHADMVKEFEVQKGNVEQMYASKLESVDALAQYFEKQLISEFDGINWEELRVKDPAEYAAARHDYSAKAGQLQSIQEAIATDKATSARESAEASQVQVNEHAKQQYDAMIANNPEWADEAVLKTARTSYVSFVSKKYGFSESEFNSVFDARLIEMIKDAKKYHEGTKVAGKKRQKPVPRFQKSRGKGIKPKASKLEKLTAASRKAKGQDKRNLQASAVAELLLGGT